jgi:hypothetical protein
VHLNLDLTQKFGPMFAASRHNVFQTVLTVRVVRNLLSHLQGRVKGLSQASFDCLCGLTSDALIVLANVLGGHHPARLTERRAVNLGFLGKPAPALPAGSQSCSRASGGGATGRFLPADDSLSACSSALTECNEEHDDVRSWGVEQVQASSSLLAWSPARWTASRLSISNQTRAQRASARPRARRPRL